MILDDIVQNKKRELSKTPKDRFRQMLERPGLSLVCELKFKSPTHPEPFIDDAQVVFDDYKAAGIDAVSVVTDQKYFGGNIDLVRQARVTGLPVLRKDFILNPRQITEVETDALLLIARILPADKLKHLVGLCQELGIEPVVEINATEELDAVLDSGAEVIAVNSRDLQAQRIDLEAGLGLLDEIPNDRLKMFFSGITTRGDLQKVKTHRVHGVLIGTSILTSEDRVNKIHELKETL